MRAWFGYVLAVGALAPQLALADTLEEALASAYATNPTLDAARAQARQTDESWAQARAGFLPQIAVTGSVSTRDTDVQTTTGSLSNRTKQSLDPEAYSVSASQTLFAGGRLTAQIGLANAQIAGSQEGLRSIEQSVLLSAIAAYVDLQRDERQLQIRENNVRLLERQTQAAKDRFEVGEITRTDVAQSQARLAGGVAGLAAARADLEASRAQYERVIGTAPGALAPTPEIKGLPTELYEAIEAGQAANPEIRRLIQAERAARQVVRIERSDLLPQVSLVGRIDRQIDTSTRGIESESSIATAQVSVPLFEGGFARSRTRSARIGVVRASFQIEEAKRAVTAQVTSAWSDLVAARSVIDASKQQVEANQFALEGVELEQQVGQRTTLDVLDAQQELLESELGLVRAERDAYLAAHVLLSAIGKLDAQSLGVNTPLYDPEHHRRAVRWTILSTLPAELH
jgi:outer membrane protein